jgi:hypothetical protein
MDAQTLIQTLTIQYHYTGYVFAGNLKGLTEGDGLKQPSGGGNCINWVTGHIVGSRGGTLKVLGQYLPFAEDKYARYERGGEPVVDGEGTVPLEEMVADFLATDEGLKAGLAGLTEARLGEKAPFSPGNNPEETVGSLLAGLVFHEGYHCGQLGVLRRMAGEDGVVK